MSKALRNQAKKLKERLIGDRHPFNIMIWAVMKVGKHPNEPLEKVYYDDPFEYYIPTPDELGEEFIQAETLGELDKLCEKHGYTFSVFPVAELQTMDEIWADELNKDTLDNYALPYTPKEEPVIEDKPLIDLDDITWLDEDE